jgi:hypothetical protein
MRYQSDAEKYRMTQWHCEIWDDEVGVVKLRMIQQRCEIWDDAVVLLNYML